MSTSKRIQKMVADAHPDLDVGQPPGRGGAGIGVTLPDGRLATWRQAPGEGWSGELFDPDGNWEDDLVNVPAYLLPDKVAENIAGQVDSLVSKVA